MGTEKIRRNSVLEKMPLVTYLILALCMACAVLSAARAYQGIADRYRDGTDARTAAQFACMKARQSDFRGGLSGSDGRLLCHELLDTGEEFTDMIYWHDGWLMELYQSSDAIFYDGADDAGDRIIPCGDAEFSVDGNTVSYRITAGGREASGEIYLRGGGRP